MAKSKQFVFGWCATGHCGYCPGALRTPNDPKQPDAPTVALCTHPCHAGQDVAPPEEYVKPLTDAEIIARELKEWYSQLIVHQHLEIPCSEDTYKSIATRLRNAATKAQVVIKTRYNSGDNELRMWVV